MADIRQTRTFATTPARLFEALVDPTQHAAFTGASASGEADVGAAFTAWDAFIEGRHLVLEPGVRIVQAWRAADWPAGHWSVVRYELAERESGEVVVHFEQAGVPNDFAEAIAKGWQDYYWTPLAEWLAAL